MTAPTLSSTCPISAVPVGNPILLLPGDCELTVTIPNASGKGKKSKMTRAFSVDVTDFVQTIVVAF